jgi:glycerol-3-phosphate acyltransferase PlsY
MPPIAASILAVAAGYLLGAVPFAYLIVRARKGLDIRTVGSGNVGATNAGRVLGFRYFLLIFALDVLKGLLPTLLLPRLAAAISSGAVSPALPVFVALATILGHNFPIYLGFKGGKGVATSLGAMFALDPAASASAAVMFLFSLQVTRYVSMSSVLGAIAFGGVHFLQVEHPFEPAQWPMTAVTILLVVMLVYRHRANLVRIGKGTEPTVNLSRRRRPADAHATDRPSPSP